jgi:hypothetical protein
MAVIRQRFDGQNETEPTNKEARFFLGFQLFAEVGHLVLEGLASILEGMHPNLLAGACRTVFAPDQINQVLLDAHERRPVLLESLGELTRASCDF